jgi:uncharacterized protein
MQSVVCTLVFYGYGLGFLRAVAARLAGAVRAGAVLPMQVLFSHWWLARFRFGPAEWLWRSLTYLRLQPMRRADPVAGLTAT